MFGLRKRVKALEQKVCEHDWEFISRVNGSYYNRFVYYKKCKKCGLMYRYTSTESSSFYYYKMQYEIDKIKQEAESYGYKLVKMSEKKNTEKMKDDMINKG